VTRVCAIIPAAGKGIRAGEEEPKQFRMLGDYPLIAWGAFALTSVEDIKMLVVGAPESNVGKTASMVEPVKREAELVVVPGGKERQETVSICLDAAGDGWDAVVIHDAARPFVTSDLIRRTIEAAIKHGAATAAVRPSDTVRQDGGGNLEREKLWLVQTPQAFRPEVIRDAHEAAKKRGITGTDDAGLAEMAGHKVAMVEGYPWNFKITTPDDWLTAEALTHACGVAPAGTKKR